MTEFSRRHYEALARVIREHISRDKECCHYVIADIVDMFEGDNPNFDSVRFIKACGLGRFLDPEDGRFAAGANRHQRAQDPWLNEV